MSHKNLDFNRELQTLLLCAGHIPKANLVLSNELQATLLLKERVLGGRESSVHDRKSSSYAEQNLQIIPLCVKFRIKISTQKHPSNQNSLIPDLHSLKVVNTLKKKNQSP